MSRYLIGIWPKAVDWSRAVLAVVLALGAGWLAWSGLPLGVASVAALPLLWRQARSATEAAILYLAFFAGGNIEEVRALLSFFPSMSLVTAIFLFLVHGALLSLPFGLARRVPERWRSLGFAAALVLVSVPPLGAVGQLSPLLLSGHWFPGAGWPGLLAMLALLAGMTATRPVLRAGSLALMLVLAWACHSLSHAPQPPSWLTTATTHLPGYDGTLSVEDFAARQSRLMSLARPWLRRARPGDVLVFPENAAGPWSHVGETLWAPIADQARSRGVLILLGASVPTGVDQTWYNAAVLLGAEHGQVNARQPVPLSSWRPGGRDSAVTDWGRTGYRKIAGHRIALSFCYESILGWPVLWQFLGQDPPEVIVELANHHWESPDSEETWIQRKALTGLGRLFGVPVLFADNRP